MPRATRHLLLLVCFAASTLDAQIVEEPSQRPLFTWRDAVLAGGFVVGTVAIRPVDKSAATKLQGNWPQGNRNLRRAASGLNRIAVPGAVIIGATMYATGR